MRSGKRKKTVIILLSGIIILIGLIIYFSQKQWYNRDGWEGCYSKDTYLIGGVGNHEYSKNTRIHYTYVIESGGMHFELKDEDGNIIYEVDITESGDGYITFENNEPMTYYDHEYALSDDTVAYVDTYVQVQKSNFEMFLHRLNQMTNYKLFGYDFENK